MLESGKSGQTVANSPQGAIGRPYRSDVRTFYQFGWCFGLATISLIVGASPEVAAWILAGAMTAQVLGRAAVASFNRAWIKYRVRELSRLPE